MSDTHTKKRPRPVVSCLRCRGKKLKCNRTLPCENCIKASCAGICTYNRDAGSTSRVNGFEVTGNESIGVNNRYTRSPTVANSNSVSSFSSSALEDLQVRLARVEEMLGVRDEQSERVEREQITTSTPQTLLGTLVVKGKRSVYHGQNDRVTLLNQVRHVLSWRGVCMLTVNSFSKSRNLFTTRFPRMESCSLRQNKSSFCRTSLC